MFTGPVDTVGPEPGLFLLETEIVSCAEIYIQVKCVAFSSPPCVTVGSLQKGNYSTQSGMIPGSWQHKMKLQLILKSSKAYYVLSDAAMSLQKYGRALRYIKLALQSHGESLSPNASTWCRAGEQRRHPSPSKILLLFLL